ncbi:protein of unknown function [Pseudomonas sp. JV551A1]|nr:protein of unknown function [Pseudomonas sp. JV551A1]
MSVRLKNPRHNGWAWGNRGFGSQSYRCFSLHIPSDFASQRRPIFFRVLRSLDLRNEKIRFSGIRPANEALPSLVADALRKLSYSFDFLTNAPKDTKTKL